MSDSQLLANPLVSPLSGIEMFLLLIAGCAHPVRQTPPRVPPPSSSESRAMNVVTDSTREYSGEWESGIETSIFRGCNGTMPGHVWVKLAPSATMGARWYDNSGGAASTRTYFVRVRGILRAPANRRETGTGYGHSSASDYELYVTRVLEVKPPGQPNCIIQR